MRLHLMGRHAHRIPLAYPAYRALAKGIELVSTPTDADFLVFGFIIDIKDHVDAVVEAKRRNPNVALVVLSEEPLWDTVWTAGYRIREQHIEVGANRLVVHLLNHFTTEIFDFVNFPYFLTTDDRYFVRYQALFCRNAVCSEQGWMDHWSRAPVLAAFVAEYRVGPEFDIAQPELDTYGLCEFRTRVAAAVSAPSAIRIGQGWPGTAERRQSLPDWHLDKLATLDGRSRFVSGLENTHHRTYLTEKLFDAFAAQGVPLYFASPAHRAHSIVPEGSFVNLFGRKSEDAARDVQSFILDRAFAARYCAAQYSLRSLFSQVGLFVQERIRLLDAVKAELRRVQSAGERERSH